MKRVYFHGCALNLKGKDGKYIKKPWCVSTSDLRLIQFFSQYVCSGDHEHEEALGKNAADSAYYTPEFANTLLEAWYPRKWYKSVPALDSASALVTLNLSRSAWLQDEKGVQAVLKEAQGLRDNGTWDDESVIPVTELRRKARQKGEKMKIAEVLTLCGIKHHEMSPEHHRYKGRIVYRGDAIRDEHHQYVLFEDTATTPTALAALNLTLWFGCMTTLYCADCIQAYLHCDLDDKTWVILPYELWLDAWKQKYDKDTKLAVRLIRSLYGHPQAGSTARSTREAELIAFASALFGEVLNLHEMAEYITDMAVPVRFEQDNQAAITVIRSGYGAKLRHLGRVHKVNIQSVNEKLENHTFSLEYCETSMQLANGFTKIISKGTEWQNTLQQLCVRLAS
eukprot:s1336_g19.t1